MTDDLLALERRRDELAGQADALAKQNQAARMHVLLRARTDSIVMVVAFLVAGAIGVAIGATWFPTVHLYLVLCR